jgi:hypothetical protein
MTTPFQPSPDTSAAFHDSSLNEKYDEILRSLLSAGYFRVLLTALSPFDKVVGGLSWCLMSAGVARALDVTEQVVFFQENMNIGQKMFV